MSEVDNEKSVDIELEDELVDSEDYQRALEALNSKKSARVKEIKEKKAAKKAQEKESANGGNKKDPVIPVCIFLAFFVLAGSLFYFLLPIAMYPSMDFTYDEFRDRFEHTAVYSDILSNFGFDLNEVTYTNDSEGSMAFKTSGKSNYIDYFEKSVSTQFPVAIQGQSRKFDGKVTFIRAICEFDDRFKNENTLLYYFATVLNALYRDRSSQECYDLAYKLVTTKTSYSTYAVDGKYAYRVVYSEDSSLGRAYIALEAMSAKNVS